MGKPMLNRRDFVAFATASGLLSGVGLAQAPALRAYGYPAGTRPFAPDVYRDRRRRLMERMNHYDFPAPLRLSVGAACYPTDAVDAQSLQRQAVSHPVISWRGGHS